VWLWLPEEQPVWELGELQGQVLEQPVLALAWRRALASRVQLALTAELDCFRVC
jgi:hypothetical protein